ncbi:MAG: calcium-binding protein [Leptolyngbyaceae cyanobacterium SM1_3_5]|nr:calcium-binding protein [Leptolyngbyaceae cyanobacterium SM1_3_5]
MENLTLIGTADRGIGNDLDNTIIGNDSGNFLDGGLGADQLEGRDGGDTYTISEEGDRIIETGTTGVDRVISSISFTLANNLEILDLIGTAATGIGNGSGNTINGNEADNFLDGLGGADLLNGGAGSDTYRLDDVGDRVSDTGTDPADIDTVFSSVGFTLGTNLDNLILEGTNAINGGGNELNNSLQGNAGSNQLIGDQGDDILNGGALNDDLQGGQGNDTYFVDNTGDRVSEAVNAGLDTVFSSVTFTLRDNVEILTLTGDANIDGTGNRDANTITGNSGNNRLDGGFGADRLEGLAGSDTYLVDNLGDTVIEGSDPRH